MTRVLVILIYSETLQVNALSMKTARGGYGGKKTGNCKDIKVEFAVELTLLL